MPDIHGLLSDNSTKGGKVAAKGKHLYRGRQKTLMYTMPKRIIIPLTNAAVAASTATTSSSSLTLALLYATTAAIIVCLPTRGFVATAATTDAFPATSYTTMAAAYKSTSGSTSQYRTSTGSGKDGGIGSNFTLAPPSRGDGNGSDGASGIQWRIGGGRTHDTDYQQDEATYGDALYHRLDNQTPRSNMPRPGGDKRGRGRGRGSGSVTGRTGRRQSGRRGGGKRKEGGRNNKGSKSRGGGGGNRSRARRKRDKVLHLAGLFPLSVGEVGRGVLPAVQMAIEHVNKHPDILPGYTLEMTWNDTQCDMAVGTKLFFDMMHEDPPKVMLFGGACSHVTAPIAESSIWWRVWQLSYADTNPILSDRQTYPHFFRTVPSDSDFNPARIQMMNYFNWTRVGTLFQDASKGSRFAYAHNKLVDLLDKAGIDREMESFSNDPKPALTNLKQKDIRIIIGNFDEMMARKVFCAAIEQKMVGPKHVWILLGDYTATWWQDPDTSIPCSPGQLRRAIEHYFSTDVLPLSTSGRLTLSGLTAEKYERLYEAASEGKFSKFHGYAYDGVWVVARAIDQIIAANGGSYALNDFRGERLHAALNETNFQGVTGRVSFSNGDRIGEIVINQFQGSGLVKVGEYSAFTNSLDLSKGTDILWRGKGPPRDRTRQERHLQRVNLTMYVIFCIISSLGIIVALSFLAINIKFRKHRYIKMSSPNMNNVIIVGCVLSYVAVFLMGTDGGLVSPEHFPLLCTARSWILSVAFTLSFGAMFSKTWRVHAIFTNIKLNRKVIKDYRLFMLVAFLLCVDIILLGTWHGMDPVRRETKELPSETDPDGGDMEIIPIIEFCISDYMNIWLGVIYAYKGLLLIFGCFLAWETRSVSIPALNDSKYVGMSVYNVVIMCVSGVPISFIMQDRQDAAYLITGIFVIFCTSITILLVFVPKCVELRRCPKGDDKRVRATLKKSAKRESMMASMHSKLRHLAEENYKFKKDLEVKNHKISELLLQLGEDGVLVDGVTRSPAHRAVGALRATANADHNMSPSRMSTGTLCSDDDQSVLSMSSVTNLWPVDRDGKIFINRQDSVDTNVTETIELTDIGRYGKLPALRSFSGSLEEQAELEEDDCARRVPAEHDPFVPPPSYEEARAARPPPAGGLPNPPRTPSYQGLKFLIRDDLYLKETAILSDSDPETASVRSATSLPDLEVMKVARLQKSVHSGAAVETSPQFFHHHWKGAQYTSRVAPHSGGTWRYPVAVALQVRNTSAALATTTDRHLEAIVAASQNPCLPPHRNTLTRRISRSSTVDTIEEELEQQISIGYSATRIGTRSTKSDHYNANLQHHHQMENLVLARDEELCSGKQPLLAKSSQDADEDRESEDDLFSSTDNNNDEYHPQREEADNKEDEEEEDEIFIDSIPLPLSTSLILPYNHPRTTPSNATVSTQLPSGGKNPNNNPNNNMSATATTTVGVTSTTLPTTATPARLSVIRCEFIEYI